MPQSPISQLFNYQPMRDHDPLYSETNHASCFVLLERSPKPLSPLLPGIMRLGSVKLLASVKCCRDCTVASHGQRAASSTGTRAAPPGKSSVSTDSRCKGHGTAASEGAVAGRAAIDSSRTTYHRPFRSLASTLADVYSVESSRWRWRWRWRCECTYLQHRAD